MTALAANKPYSITPSIAASRAPVARDKLVHLAVYRVWVLLRAGVGEPFYLVTQPSAHSETMPVIPSTWLGPR